MREADERRSHLEQITLRKVSTNYVHVHSGGSRWYPTELSTWVDSSKQAIRGASEVPVSACSTPSTHPALQTGCTPLARMRLGLRLLVVALVLGGGQGATHHCAESFWSALDDGSSVPEGSDSPNPSKLPRLCVKEAGPSYRRCDAGAPVYSSSARLTLALSGGLGGPLHPAITPYPFPSVSSVGVGRLGKM